MEDQILHVDTMEEATPDANLSKKLLKKEQRLCARLEEEQEAEARALDRFQRAQARLERRRKRLERIQGKLVLVREQIADLGITDQQTVLVIAATPALTPGVNAEEIAVVQIEQDSMVVQESDVSSPSFVENTSSKADEPETVITSEDTTNAISTVEPEALTPAETEVATPLSETEPVVIPVKETDSSSDAEFDVSNLIEQEPVATTDSTLVEPEVVATSEIDTSSDAIEERKPTKPLRLEQEDQSAGGSLSPGIQAAKEGWIAAESAMQNARNAAHGIAASISFLSQTDGLSNEFMEELVRKQADANKELLKAQDAARAAYERFVQAQRDTEYAAIVPVDVSMNTSGDHSQQQENGALPPAEDNGADQTAKLHSIRLYEE